MSQERQPRKRRLSEAAVIDALRKCGGIVAHAAELLGVPRTSVSNYLSRPRVRQVVNDERDALVDQAESALFAAVRAQEPWAIKLVLLRSRHGRLRGYGVTQAVEVAGEVEVEPAPNSSGKKLTMVADYLESIGAGRPSDAA